MTSVNSEVGAVVLDAADVGAAPITRNLTAGTALSGGGDLSADRVFDVDLGTTAGTAAEGNDARITGAQQRSTLTTKGDLYAATGAATVVRRSVGTDGQVLTAASAQADGVVWATPASAPVTSVNTETGAVVLDATDVGAQPVDSDLTTIAALAPADDSIIQRKSGIWVSRTMAQVKTDLAITPADIGAQALATVTTKGDLYVATANATTARQAVGADATVLTADSSLTNGVKWLAPVAPLAAVPRSTGYTPTGGVVTARSSKSATLNVMYLMPFVLERGATTSNLAFEVTGNVVNAVARLGFYGSNSAFLPTGNPIVDFGTTAADTIGTKTPALVQALPAGVLWLAFAGQVAAPTVRQCTGWTPYVSSATFPAGSGVGWDNCWVQTGVTGTLPAIGALVDSDGPMCGIKF